MTGASWLSAWLAAIGLARLLRYQVSRRCVKAGGKSPVGLQVWGFRYLSPPLRNVCLFRLAERSNADPDLIRITEEVSILLNKYSTCGPLSDMRVGLRSVPAGDDMSQSSSIKCVGKHLLDLHGAVHRHNHKPILSAWSLQFVISSQHSVGPISFQKTFIEQMLRPGVIYRITRQAMCPQTSKSGGLGTAVICLGDDPVCTQVRTAYHHIRNGPLKSTPFHDKLRPLRRVPCLP